MQRILQDYSKQKNKNKKNFARIERTVGMNF